MYASCGDFTLFDLRINRMQAFAGIECSPGPTVQYGDFLETDDTDEVAEIPEIVIDTFDDIGDVPGVDEPKADGNPAGTATRTHYNAHKRLST